MHDTTVSLSILITFLLDNVGNHREKSHVTHSLESNGFISLIVEL